MSELPARPNLFQFAYAEHAQDALLAWLLTWAHPRYARVDPGLHTAGRNLLERLLVLDPVTAGVQVRNVEVRQQLGGVDVLVIVNGEVGIVVENKVDSPIRKSQLDTYLQTVRAGGVYRDVTGVFVKTGDQDPSQAALEEAGHPVLLRRDLLEIIEEGVRLGVRHDALVDYRNRLQQMESDTASFATLPVVEWGLCGQPGLAWEEVRARRSRWAGFFTALQSSLAGSRWNYVPNQNRGFMGLWWGFPPPGEPSIYLQLEDHRLVFKVIVDDVVARSSSRWHWHERVLGAASSAGLGVAAPERFGSGKTMTVACLADDYRRPDASGRVDLFETLETLRAAQRVLEATRVQIP